jgi:hypothetical protein
MKNLFYVCLVAMLSLGLTGFTTVEEDLSSPDCEQLCTGVAIDMYDAAKEQDYSDRQASNWSDMAYSSCMNRCTVPQLTPM